MASHHVVGLDTDSGRVASVNAGVPPVESVTEQELADLLARGFRATEDPTVLATADVIVICVPTPLRDGQPDLAALDAAARAIRDHLRPGTLVVLESTTYPGTTEDLLAPILAESGLTVGADFALAFSPERVDPGNRRFGIRNTPKIVAGITRDCARAATGFYSSFVAEVVTAKGPREAETAKLLESTYRYVNIALVNELAQACHELGIDVWDVIRCAATKPYGFHTFTPGPGVGGDCIPVDPHYLNTRVKTSLGHPLRLVELAHDINHGMPHHVVRRAQDVLNARKMAVNGAQILLVGITYKSDVADLRESPAVPIARRLIGMGADLAYHDPHIHNWIIDGKPIPTAALTESERFDLAVFLQHHRGVDTTLIQAISSAVLDTRGRLRGTTTSSL